MSQKGLSMQKIEGVLRLKYEARLSHRAMAQSLSKPIWGTLHIHAEMCNSGLSGRISTCPNPASSVY
jgi:hypothetical protein